MTTPTSEPTQLVPTTPAPHPVDAGEVLNSEVFVALKRTLDDSKDTIDNELFLYQAPSYQWEPSSVYRYADFFESLRVMASEGVAGNTFYIADDREDGHIYGLVNIAAFFAQSIKETIQYDAW